MAQNRDFVPPDTPRQGLILIFFPGQQHYTYALGYSKLIVTQKNMIPTWKTEEKRKIISKNGQKWVKMAQKVQIYPLTSHENPFYEFSRGYRY